MMAPRQPIPITLEFRGPIIIQGAAQNGQGVLLPLHCPRDGYLPVVLGVLARSVRLTATEDGCARAECPVCKDLVPIEDGLYEFANYVRGALAAANLTSQQAASALSAIQGTDPEKMAQAVACVSPDIAALVAEALKGTKRSHRIAALMMALSALIAGPPSLESAIEVYDRAIYGPDHLREKGSAPQKQEDEGHQEAEDQASDPAEARPDNDAYQADKPRLPPVTET